MALVEAVRRANPAAIHLGASVTQITETEDGVVVGLVDGRSVAGSLLVGADGVHSVTRSALFGAAKKYCERHQEWCTSERDRHASAED
jgi:2-polyprenyl-6-methoxyphenol hydroxylase-like FAD-dependent oxidoreductase